MSDIWVDEVSDLISLLENSWVKVVSLNILDLGISLLKDSFVVSLLVSDIWVDNISDSISLLEICELDILSPDKLVLGISLLIDSFIVSL